MQQFSNWHRIFLNKSPWRGFVKISAVIFPVGKYSILMSFFSTRSLMKKYLTLMCLVRAQVDLPLSTSAMVLLLSWKIVAGGTEYPCSVRKLRVQMTCEDSSDNPINSVSVDDFETNFCFADFAWTMPFPSVIADPVWPLPFGWTPWEQSMNAETRIPSSISRVRANSRVAFR